MNERKWITGDDCISCGYGRVFFFDERTEDGPDGRKHFGDLICAACGASQKQGCLDIQLPNSAPEPGPLFKGGVQDSADRPVKGQLALDLEANDGRKIY
jgi:hypothetical protein